MCDYGYRYNRYATDSQTEQCEAIGATEDIVIEKQTYFLRSYSTFEEEVAGLSTSGEAASLISEFQSDWDSYRDSPDFCKYTIFP